MNELIFITIMLMILIAFIAMEAARYHYNKIMHEYARANGKKWLSGIGVFIDGQRDDK